MPDHATFGRRRIDYPLIGLVITLCLNVGALVWGAATISAAVEQLDQAVEKLEGDSGRAWGVIYDHDGRLRVLESFHRIDGARPGGE